MANGKKPSAAQIKRLRSRQWFDNPDNPDMTALYLERYMNYGLTREELQSGKPIIGIAQSGSDLSPCNRHHIVLARARARRHPRGRRHRLRVPRASDPGDRQAPDRGARPQPRLSRPGRDALRLSSSTAWCSPPAATRPRPSQLMAAATVDIPAIVLSGGPMLNGWFRGERTGSGTIVWKARADARGRRDQRRGVRRARRLLGAVARPLQHHGHRIDDELARRGARHVAAGLRGPARAPQGARAARLRDRQAHRRDGVGGPASLQDHDARGVRERDRRQLGDRRLDQRADPLQCDRAPHRRQARQRRLGEGRLRHPAAGQPAAGRRVPGRGVSPRRRRARRRQRADEGRQDPPERADRERQARSARTAPSGPSTTTTSSAPTRSR